MVSFDAGDFAALAVFHASARTWAMEAGTVGTNIVSIAEHAVVTGRAGFILNCPTCPLFSAVYRFCAGCFLTRI